MSADLQRPLPLIDIESQPYWEALRRHHFSAPLCEDCGLVFLYPRALCPRCHGGRQHYVPLSGRGTIYSFTVSRRAAAPAFESETPLVVVLVDLAEGPRILSNLLGADPVEVRVGDPVELDYLDISNDVTLPVFRIAASAAERIGADE